MSAKLSDFLAHIKKNNIVRSNRFRITFSLPAALTALIGGTASIVSTVLGSSSVGVPSALVSPLGVSNVISLTCMSTDIPGITIHTTESNYGSLPRQIVNGRSYDNFMTSFLLSGPMIEKKLFDEWYNTIFNDSNNSINYYDDYVCSLLVEQLDQNDKVIYVVELMEAFPLHISEVKLDRTTTNQQATIDVNWMFHRLRVNPDSFSLSAIAGAIAASTTTATTLGGEVGSALNNLSSLPTNPSAITAVPLYPDNTSRLDGIIEGINNVISQVKDGSISNLDGVKIINASYRDFNAIPSVSPQLKADVLVAVNTAKSQMSNMSTDPSTITA